jgi:hypothetical protein
MTGRHPMLAGDPADQRVTSPRDATAPMLLARGVFEYCHGARSTIRIDATTTGEYGQSKRPGRDKMGYDAAFPDKAAFHRALPAISFLYLISARG